MQDPVKAKAMSPRTPLCLVQVRLRRAGDECESRATFLVRTDLSGTPQKIVSFVVWYQLSRNWSGLARPGEVDDVACRLGLDLMINFSVLEVPPVEGDDGYSCYDFLLSWTGMTF